MRILLVTDAWHPQINGVVRSLENLIAFRPAHVTIDLLTAADFRTLPLPYYPEIRLALVTPGMVARRLKDLPGHAVHIATEGSLGHAARRACLALKRPFTTSYHTKLPEYVADYTPIPKAWSYAWLARFHNAGTGTFVSTRALQRELMAKGFDKVLVSPLGVDTRMFRPGPVSPLVAHLPRPIFMNVGRVSVEKNIEAFLALNLPGSKVLVGDGPLLPVLRQAHPDVTFLGPRSGSELVALYGSADVFVFPSRTDTFGLVLLEAMACGTPVAAFPEPGPLEAIGPSAAGIADADLREAAMRALSLDRQAARQRAQQFSWDVSAERFCALVAAAQARPADEPSAALPEPALP